MTDGSRWVLASHNEGKVRELNELFRRLPASLVPAGELELPEPEETGATFEANAELKAVAAASAVAIAVGWGLLVITLLSAYLARIQRSPVLHVVTEHLVIAIVVLGLIAIGLATMLNPQAQLLAVIGAVLTIAYPFIKRYVSIPQFVLGAAFGWAVPMAFAAQTGAVPAIAWWLFAVVLLWAVAYDTMYAMVDRQDDLKVGIKSSAILFGKRRTKMNDEFRKSVGNDGFGGWIVRTTFENPEQLDPGSKLVWRIVFLVSHFGIRSRSRRRHFYFEFANRIWQQTIPIQS